MENALLMTGLLILAALAGGVIGSACAKKKNDPSTEGRVAELEDRLDALADHVMDQTHAIREQVNEHDLLIGETPNDGLLGRVGNLEEAERHRPSGPKLVELVSCVDAQADELETLKGRLDAFENSMTLEMTGLREELEMRHG